MRDLGDVSGYLGTACLGTEWRRAHSQNRHHGLAEVLMESLGLAS